MDEKSEITARLVSINDQINSKSLELRDLVNNLDRSVGPILDAPSKAIREKLARQRRQDLDTCELLRAELDLLSYRRLECETALRRLGEVFTTFNLPRYEPIPEQHR